MPNEVLYPSSQTRPVCLSTAVSGYPRPRSNPSRYPLHTPRLIISASAIIAASSRNQEQASFNQRQQCERAETVNRLSTPQDLRRSQHLPQL
ncbi:hypothetical protein CF319_g9628 [Tilletia indica]|nr:hypothetical protein CF319_g9628 [Tilletia indica]